MHPRLAITLGDPRGIGPEIVAKVLADPPCEAEFVVVGPDDLVGDLPAVERIGIGEWGGGRSAYRGSTPPSSPLPGLLAGRAIETAARLALDGHVHGIVTAPADKHALREAGYDHPGHTEFLAALAGGVDVAMMLVAGTLRVVLVTTHLPLRAVPDAVTTERVVAVGRLTAKALRAWWAIPTPRLAVCALNPHAGERGLFGDEDARVLAPAAQALDAAGPVPADTVFVRALRGEFDAVLTPYHDVGMTAVKVAGFGKGVNVTLGLPFVRTSPDHGTALDIAGRGVADPGSMREAVALAARLAVVGSGASEEVKRET